MGPSMGMVVEEESMETNELDDEINNLLLKHERSNKQQTALIPGQEDSDSDNR